MIFGIAGFFELNNRKRHQGREARADGEADRGQGICLRDGRGRTQGEGRENLRDDNGRPPVSVDERYDFTFFRVAVRDLPSLSLSAKRRVRILQQKPDARLVGK